MTNSIQTEFHSLDILDNHLYSQDNLTDLVNNEILPKPEPLSYESSKKDFDKTFKDSIYDAFIEWKQSYPGDSFVNSIKAKYLIDYVSAMTQLPKNNVYISTETAESMNKAIEFAATPKDLVDCANKYAAYFLTQDEIKSPDLREYIYDVKVSTDLTYTFSLSDFGNTYGYDPTDADPAFLLGDVIDRLEKENSGMFELNSDSIELDEVWQDENDPDVVNIGLTNISGSFSVSVMAASYESAQDKLNRQLLIKNSLKFYGDLFMDSDAHIEEVSETPIISNFNHIDEIGRQNFDLDLRMPAAFRELCEKLLIQVQKDMCDEMKMPFDDAAEKSIYNFVNSSKSANDHSFFNGASLEYINMKMKEMSFRGSFETVNDLSEIVECGYKETLREVCDHNFNILAKNALLEHYDNLLKEHPENAASMNKEEHDFVKNSMEAFVDHHKHPNSLRYDSVIDAFNTYADKSENLKPILDFLNKSNVNSNVQESGLKM